MSLYRRLGMYFFIVGAILTVLDGVFPVDLKLKGYIYVILVFTGVFAGIMNITPDEEHHFLVSSTAFLLIIVSFELLFSSNIFIEKFTTFFQNSIAFVGSMALIVSLKAILEFGSDNYRVTPVENIKIRTKDIEEWQLSKGIKRWHFVIFIAVALTFLLILFEIFFTLPKNITKIVVLLNWLITIIFIADLFVLYRHEKTPAKFFKNCWIDILASIPFSGMFAAFKIVRIARIADISKSAKFFSEESGIENYLKKNRVHEEPRSIKEHPKTRQLRTK